MPFQHNHASASMYSKTTQSIEISAIPEYLPEHAAPLAHHYVWSYTIRIRNSGSATVKLLTRHWQVIDAQGNMQEVNGDGVVGVQPIIKTGESFEYSSGTHLPTPSGMMMGSYVFCYLDSNGDAAHEFDVEIPAFSLDIPNASHALN